MNSKGICVLLVSLLLTTVFLTQSFSHAQVPSSSTPDVYVGVDIAYGDVPDAKALIDKVSNYTNLIIIGTSKITNDVAKLNQTFQYAYDKGLSFIAWTPDIRGNKTQWFEWFTYAKNTWGNRLLGFYLFDEIGGRQLDRNQTFLNANDTTTYVDAADQFENMVGYALTSTTTRTFNSINFPLFTSDYALYWFDYKAGYDVVFSEFAWNYDRQLNIALDRGAATVQNKDWGAIITWKYAGDPYIESGGELYSDMVLAYDNGAKYVVVFDANEGWTQSILKDEHIQAMQMFSEYIKNNPRQTSPAEGRIAYALPDGYGFGFRGPNDWIWGLWSGDDSPYHDQALAISTIVKELLNDYGNNLDLIYDNGLQSGNPYGYSQIIYWNDPGINPVPYPSNLPTQTPLQTPIPSVSLSPSSSHSPSAIQKPSPNPSLSSSLTPASPNPGTGLSLAMNYVYAAVALAAVTVFAVLGILAKKRAKAT